MGQALLNGTLVDDGGQACDCGFQWGLTIAYGNTTATQSKTIGQSFFIALLGLAAGATYHFRTFATNSLGTAFGDDAQFSTPVTPPPINGVTTDLATNLRQTSARLDGTLVDDGGANCAVSFEWGLTATYGNVTATQVKSTGQIFFIDLAGLTPNTVYHFRAKAVNFAGTSFGIDRTFTTAPIILPNVQTVSPDSLGLSQSHLRGTLIDDGGELCVCGFEWGLVPNPPLGNITSPLQSRNSASYFDFLVGGLYPNITYYFRAFATNSAGTSYGNIFSYQTRPSINKAHALSREEL